MTAAWTWRLDRITHTRTKNPTTTTLELAMTTRVFGESEVEGIWLGLSACCGIEGDGSWGLYGENWELKGGWIEFIA